MDRILQKLEDYKKRVEMLEADILTKDATIIELTASVENKEGEIGQDRVNGLAKAPMVTYTWTDWVHVFIGGMIYVFLFFFLRETLLRAFV